MQAKDAATLIKTKLVPPVVSTNQVCRSRLLSELTGSDQYKLVLLTAPAGFGKTTYLGQLYQSLVDHGGASAWLTLGPVSRLPESFLRYFIAALQTIDPDLGSGSLERLNNASVKDITDELGSLANDLMLFQGSVYLFIDNIQSGESDVIEHFIELLLDVSPPNFHLVLASRALLGFSLARLMVRNDLVHISSDKLRFNDDEAHQFVTEEHGINLSRELTAQLNLRCEGWVAALQLACLSLKDAQSKEKFISGFSGKARDIAEYLAVDVLGKQPERIRDFLYHTSVLDRFNVELSRHVSGEADTRGIIDYLEEKSLFIAPLDNEANWYRFHSLFREFLLSRLEERQESDQRLICKLAGGWCADNGYFDEAVEYMLRGGFAEAATSIIEECAQNEFNEGYMPRVAAWTRRIPRDIQLERPRLMLLNAVALGHMSRAEDCIQVVQQIERNLHIYDAQLQEDIKTQLDVQKCSISMMLDNVSDATKYFNADLELLPEFTRGMTDNIQGYSHLALGNFEQARKHLERARALHFSSRSSFGLVYSDCFMSLMALMQGDLPRARDAFEYTNRLFSEIPFNARAEATKNVLLAAIDYEMNRESEHLRNLQSNLELMQQLGHISLIQVAYTTLARYMSKQGNADLGLDALKKLSRAYPSGFTNRFHDLVVAYNEIRILLRAGRQPEAMKVADTLQIDLDANVITPIDEWLRETFYVELIKVRLWLQSKNHRAALQQLESMLMVVEAGGLWNLGIECLLLKVRALAQSGAAEQATEALLYALGKAAPSSMYRIFIDEGAALLPVMLECQLRSDGEQPEFRRFLDELVAIVSRLSHVAPEPAASGNALLIEPLSQRELAILELIAAGRSNSQIADVLSISENTVKWHCSNLFGKINVRNRTEAVVVGQNLGILKRSA